MLCENCQNAEATIHQIQMSDGQVTHLQLCKSCAEETTTGSESGASVASLASSLFGSSSPTQTGEQTQCSHCGLTFQEFRESGRVGCAGCYDSFRDRMESLIHRIHGADRHVGSSSAGSGLSTVSDERKIQLLEKDLERKVQEEQYEEAAELRDKIEELKQEENDDASD